MEKALICRPRAVSVLGVSGAVVAGASRPARQSDGNMLQVLIRIVCRGHSRASTVVGFNR